jgi:hypothetical protein
VGGVSQASSWGSLSQGGAETELAGIVPAAVGARLD